MGASKNKLSPDSLAEVLFQSLGLSKSLHFNIAYSGGLDSCVLLDLMSRLRKSQGLRIHALHFNHGLQAESDSWAESCQEFCLERNISHAISSTQAKAIKIDSKKGIEASARKARYAWFKQQLGGVNNAVLLTAHHADDQAETILFNLVRGAGVSGLRGMAQVNLVNGVELVRPLLYFTRHEIEQYAKETQLKWIEDPSNQDQRYSRNKLRYSVIPKLNEVKLGAVQQIVKAGQHIAETEGVLNSLAEQDIACIKQKEYCPLDGSQAIDLDGLKALCKQSDNARVKNVLKFWLKSVGVAKYNSQILKNLQQWVEEGASSNSVIEVGEFCIRYFRRFAYVMPRNSIPFPKKDSFMWDGKAPLQLEELKVQIENRGNQLMQAIEVFVGNDSFPEKKLKKRFQTAGVPIWLRQVTPIIRQGEDVFCLAFRDENRGFMLTEIA